MSDNRLRDLEHRLRAGVAVAAEAAAFERAWQRHSGDLFLPPDLAALVDQAEPLAEALHGRLQPILRPNRVVPLPPPLAAQATRSALTTGDTVVAHGDPPARRASLASLVIRPRGEVVDFAKLTMNASSRGRAVSGHGPADIERAFSDGRHSLRILDVPINVAARWAVLAEHGLVVGPLEGWTAVEIDREYDRLNQRLMAAHAAESPEHKARIEAMDRAFWDAFIAPDSDSPTAESTELAAAFVGWARSVDPTAFTRPLSRSAGHDQAHRHRWVRFRNEGATHQHERCACGATRTVRHVHRWERSAEADANLVGYRCRCGEPAWGYWHEREVFAGDIPLRAERAAFRNLTNRRIALAAQAFARRFVVKADPTPEITDLMRGGWTTLDGLPEQSKYPNLTESCATDRSGATMIEKSAAVWRWVNYPDDPREFVVWFEPYTDRIVHEELIDTPKNNPLRAGDAWDRRHWLNEKRP